MRLKIKSLVDGSWKYEDANRSLMVGDVIEFTCNGSGRGGHYRVLAVVTKVNKKTFKATEKERSHDPGTLWVYHMDSEDTVYIQNEERK